MKKQVIRLTENDLHKIIKESVKQIIKEKQVKEFTPYSKEDREENFKGLTHGTPEERNPSYAKAKKAAQERMAKKKGSKKPMEESSLNELDPRTYASYASKRQAQADAMPKGFKKDQMNGKATDGRYAATNAFNQQFGRDSQTYNGFGDRFDNQSYMQNGEYNVHDNNGYIGKNGERGYTTRNFDPKTNQISYSQQRYDANGRNTLNQQGVQQSDGYSNERFNVARQMQNGTGKYNNGKWQ